MLAARLGLSGPLAMFWRRMSVGIALAAALLLPGLLLAQDGLAPIPALNARVIDTTATLDAGQRQALEAKLADFEQKRGTQIVVLMVPTTQPEDIVGYTQRVGNLWKIGRKDVGDGVLIVVAKNDRTVRIATAKTLEGAVPDLAARQIISEAITPRFREGDFAGGLSAGLDRLMGLIRGEQLPAPAGSSGTAGGESGLQWFDMLVLLFFVVPLGVRVLGGIFGRKSGALLTAGGIGVVSWMLTTSVVVAVLAGMAGLVFALASGLAGYGPAFGGGAGRRGRGSWNSGAGGWGHGGHGGWGGSGGGGFSSGGGGDFGGGGASGKW